MEIKTVSYLKNFEPNLFKEVQNSPISSHVAYTVFEEETKKDSFFKKIFSTAFSKYGEGWTVETKKYFVFGDGALTISENEIYFIKK